MNSSSNNVSAVLPVGSMKLLSNSVCRTRVLDVVFEKPADGIDVADVDISSATDNTQNLLEKGMFIHIVDDPNVSVDQHSAVVINLPSTTITSKSMHNIDVQDEVFTTAEVTVSVQYLACIPDDKDTFFTNLCSAMDVKVSEDSDCVTIQGDWNKILLTQETMRAYLSAWKQQQLTSETFECEDGKEDYLEDVLVHGVSKNPEEIAEEALETSRTSMRTRHQEKLQREKSQNGKVQAPRKGLRTEEEECVPENKENEMHLHIALSDDRIVHDAVAEITTAPGPSSVNIKPIKSQKKNYEELAPFKFFCSMCSFKSKRESHYLQHLERHQTISSLYSCDTCNFTAIRLGHLRRHELTHSTNMLSCSMCRYRTDDERHLTRHQRIKHQNSVVANADKPVEVLSCDKCSYSTTKIYLFKRHLKVHIVGPKQEHPDPRSFQCEQCSYKSNRKEHYLRHVNNVHQNRRPYLCDLCGKAFKRPDALKQHGITHAEIDPNVAVFRCAFCNKGCRSQAHLNEHLAVHSNVRSFLCEICGLSFKTRSVQRKHVLTIHKNPHAFSCHRCLKRFNTKYALRRHMKQHSWKDDDQEECSNSEQLGVVIQTAEETEGASKASTLTVQVSEEILASLPPGAVTVPLFSVMSSMKKEGASLQGGVGAGEVLALQLRQLPDCVESTTDVTEGTVTTSQQFLPSTSDSTSNLIYVATAFEQF